MEHKWVWENRPATPGWYAVLYCWDAHEGVHIGAAYADSVGWVRTLPIVGYAGPFDTEEAADQWAVDNDPDGV